MLESRAFMIDYFNNFGRTYTVDLKVVNDAGTALEDYDMIYHTENYVYETNYGKDDNNNPYGAGFLRFTSLDEKAYLFQVKLEDNEEKIELSDKYPIDYLVKYYNPEFSVDFAKISYEYDAENKDDLFVLTGEDAADFAEASLFVPNGKVSGYAIDRVEFSIWDVSATEEPDYRVCAYPTFSVGTKKYYYGYCFLSNKAADVGYPLLDAYCVPENKPVSLDYYNEFLKDVRFFDGTEPFYGHVLSDLLLSPSGVYGATGTIETFFSWMDAETYEPFDYDLSSYETTYYGGKLPNGSKTYLTSEKGIWEVEAVLDENDEFVRYDPVSGVISASVGEPAEEKVFNCYYLGADSQEKYSAELDSARATPWTVLPADSSDVTLSGLADSTIWSEDTFGTLTAKDGKFEFSIDVAESKAVVDAILNTRPGFVDKVASTEQWFNPGYTLYDLMSCYMTFIPAKNQVEFEVYIWNFPFSDLFYYVDVIVTGDDSVASTVAQFNSDAAEYCHL